jgi:hypothetical protein
MTWSMFETLCEGKPSSSSSKGRPKRRSPETTAARAGGVDPSRTKRSRTGSGDNGTGDALTTMTTNDYHCHTYNDETTCITIYSNIL